MAELPSSPVGDPVKAAAKELEWNDRILARDRLPPYDPTKDKFCNLFKEPSSVKISAAQAHKDELRQAYRAGPGEMAPGFASIAAALDFEHHVGSDPALELRALKAIVVREGLLSQVEALVEEVMRPIAFVGDKPDYSGLSARIIEILAQVRALCCA